MNVAHPNYGQNYQLTRAALRLRSFTISELEDLTGALPNTIYSFISKLSKAGEQFVDSEKLQTLRGRPQKRYTVTDSGRRHLAELSFEMASRFGEDAEESEPVTTELASIGSMALASDIYEQGQEVIFAVDVPGMLKKDLEVRIEQNDLVVSGERLAVTAVHGVTPFMIERQHGHFVRAYPLPKFATAKIMNVEVENGVLQVTLERAVGAAMANATEKGETKNAAMVAFHELKETAG